MSRESLTMIQPTKVYEQQRCAWCQGTGKRNRAPGMPVSCFVCGGKTQVAVRQPSIECRRCNGAGSGSGSNPCMTCAGTGWEYLKT